MVEAEPGPLAPVVWAAAGPVPALLAVVVAEPVPALWVVVGPERPAPVHGAAVEPALGRAAPGALAAQLAAPLEPPCGLAELLR